MEFSEDNRQPVRSLGGGHMWLIVYSFSIFCDTTIHMSRDVLDIDKTTTVCYCCNCVIVRHLQGGFALLFKDYW